MKNNQFAPSLVPTLAMLIVFPLLISLGIWQLNRADQKRDIDRKVSEAQHKQALNVNDYLDRKSPEALLNEIYRSALITGQFDSRHQFLYDNRTHQGRAGYHVLTPLILPRRTRGEKPIAVLINRGWVPYSGQRKNIPDISVPEKTVLLKGKIKKAGHSIVLKQEESNNQNHYPLLVQSLSLDEFSKLLDYHFLPVIIELDKTEKNGFVRDWQPYFGSTSKHIGYAVQWFAMAAILLFLYIKMNIHPRSNARSNDSRRGS